MDAAPAAKDAEIEGVQGNRRVLYRRVPYPFRVLCGKGGRPRCTNCRL